VSTAVRERALHRHVAHTMGMPVSLAMRGDHADDAVGRGAWAEAMATLEDVDRVFSTYRSDSYVSRLARGEIGVADCPPEVAEVLVLAEQARVESDGAFDVRRPGPGGRRVLDPSGVVKGWATERAARVLRLLPGTDFSLSVGGDVVCHVARDSSPDWRIGIEDPHDPRRVVAVVPVRSGAVATSGAVHRGNHVVDARTGVSPRRVASVTVVHADLTWADIDATAAFAQDGAALSWLRTRRDRAGLVVWADGRREVFGRGADSGEGDGQADACHEEPDQQPR
jgi:thiamine biosynthesis lipoprotein